MWDKSLNSCNKFCRLQAVFQADLMKWNYYAKLLHWTNKASNLITNGVIIIKFNSITPLVNYWWSQLLPGGHPAIVDTPIIRTEAKSLAKINYRCLTELKSSYRLSLKRTLSQGPYSVCNKGSWLY